MNPFCLPHTVEGFWGSIMIWSMFSWHGNGALMFFEGKKIPRYAGRSSTPCNIAFLYFMDDNVPVHQARSVQNWFAEHQSDFQHFFWPPHSPDLNLIENMWDMLESRIRQHSPLPSNLQDLKSCMANAWYSLNVNALQKLVDSMPKRIRAIICAIGGPIKYWSWVSNSLASVCITFPRNIWWCSDQYKYTANFVNYFYIFQCLELIQTYI